MYVLGIYTYMNIRYITFPPPAPGKTPHPKSFACLLFALNCALKKKKKKNFTESCFELKTKPESFLSSINHKNRQLGWAGDYNKTTSHNPPPTITPRRGRPLSLGERALAPRPSSHIVKLLRPWFFSNM